MAGKKAVKIVANKKIKTDKKIICFLDGIFIWDYGKFSLGNFSFSGGIVVDSVGGITISVIGVTRGLSFFGKRLITLLGKTNLIFTERKTIIMADINIRVLFQKGGRPKNDDEESRMKTPSQNVLLCFIIITIIHSAKICAKFL